MRIALTVEGKLEEDCRKAAAAVKTPVNHWLVDLLRKHFLATPAEESAKPKRRSLKQRKADFLLAVERRYWFAPSCRLADVPRKEARGWLLEEEFAAEHDESQYAYIEGVEARMLRFGKAKGVVLAFLSFLNANHPKYGRVKIEFLNRFLGPFMDEVFKLIRQEIGGGQGGQGEKLIERIRTSYEKRLLAFTD